MFSAHLADTPVGTLRLWATDRGLRRLDFRAGSDLARPGEQLSSAAPPGHLAAALDALKAYFEGHTRTLEVPLDLGSITDFQRRVYEYLRTVPFGTITTYGTVGHALGMGEAGARAVGGAVGSNPVAVIIPCHRVVAADGSLHGFGGGLSRKATLLRLEGIEVDGVSASSRVHPEVLRLPL